MRGELEAAAREALAATLARMDLVTREEFEVQRAQLERARARLRALEETVARLEGDGPAGGHAGRDIPRD
jgi:BMFP domain-containing protein YqiC